jgi:hypothetical protein
MLSFGKFKGFTYDYVIQNDLSYCLYVLNTKTCSGQFKEFQNYLNNNIHQLYNIKKLENIGSICCSKLSQYINFDNNFIDNIKNLSINTNLCKKIKFNNNINNNLFGQFIDYLIRFEISNIKNIIFFDTRTEILLIDESLNHLTKYIQNINNSYNNLKNKKFSFIDILNVSISHSIYFNRLDDIKFINYDNEIIDNDSYNVIIDYLKNKIINVENILINPVLGDKNIGITADADLIFDNEIIDIKISKIVGNNINDFIQLIIYAVLYYRLSNKICNKLTIYNPLLDIENYIHIDINLINNVNDILLNYNINPSKITQIKTNFITPRINDIYDIYNNTTDLCNINDIIFFLSNNPNIKNYIKNVDYGKLWRKIYNEFIVIIKTIINAVKTKYKLKNKLNYNINFDYNNNSFFINISNNFFTISKNIKFIYLNNELLLDYFDL